MNHNEFLSPMALQAQRQTQFVPNPNVRGSYLFLNGWKIMFLTVYRTRALVHAQRPGFARHDAHTEQPE